MRAAWHLWKRNGGYKVYTVVHWRWVAALFCIIMYLLLDSACAESRQNARLLEQERQINALRETLREQGFLQDDH